MKRILKINTGVCDATKVTEDTLNGFDEIKINAGTILTSAATRGILTRHGAKLNSGMIIDLPEGAKVRIVNGKAQIHGSDTPVQNQFLLVNGTLLIAAGTERVLEAYCGILVNGSVLYPKSLGGYLSNIKLNGSSSGYPDEAIVLKNNTVVDRLFALRAKDALYWTPNRLIMVDPKLDPIVLAAKGVRFSGKQAIIAESKVEQLIGLLDEEMEIIIVPDGTAVITDDLTLSEATVARYGDKLYVIGDLRVEADGGAALEQLTWLNVRGDAWVVEELRYSLLKLAEEIAGDVCVIADVDPAQEEPTKTECEPSLEQDDVVKINAGEYTL